MAIEVLKNKGGEVDLEIARGISFYKVMTVKDDGVVRNITGYVFGGAVQVTGSDTPYLTFSFVILDAVNGQFSVELSPSQTEQLAVGVAYDFDIVYTTGGKTYQLLFGKVTITDSASQ